MDPMVPKTPTLARPSGSLAHVNPVGRLVTGAPESVGLHEGLQQIKAMVIASLPVGIDPLGNLRKNMAGQMRNTNPGQDQKATLVGDEGQAASALLSRPTDPLISGSALPGGRSKEQTGQIHSLATADHIAEVLAHGAAIAQVMVLGQIPLEPRMLRLPAANDTDLKRTQRGQIPDDGFRRD